MASSDKWPLQRQVYMETLYPTALTFDHKVITAMLAVVGAVITEVLRKFCISKRHVSAS